MKKHRNTLMVATAAVLFGVGFGILFLACGQREEEPGAIADAPTSAKAKPDSPPARTASKAAASNHRISYDDLRIHVQDLGEKIEGFQGKATGGDMEVALRELEAKQAQLMLELEAIGGENEKWDAARAELIPKAHELRGQVHEFGEGVDQ